MKVFLDKRIPESGLKLLNHPNIELLFPDKDKISDQEWLQYCKESDVLLSVGKANFNEDFFKQFPNVKLISLLSVGYDHVDIEAATKYGVAITNTPNVLSNATSDISFLLMQMVARYAFFNLQKVKNGEWSSNFNAIEDLGQELKGRTLGILGLGRIGYEMAKKSIGAFNMPILYHNRNRNLDLENNLNAKYVSFDELLQQSDVISIHANYTPENKHKFDKNAFSKMKSSAILVNTARGGFVNEDDLYEALRTDKIFGAGLDVTEKEPLPKESKLNTINNICIFPHIGSATVEARNGMAEVAASNIIAFVEGKKMPTIVNSNILKK